MQQALLYLPPRLVCINYTVTGLPWVLVLQAELVARQMAAAQLLKALVATSSRVAEDLVGRGGLAVLLGLALGPGVVQQQEAQVGSSCSMPNKDFSGL